MRLFRHLGRSTHFVSTLDSLFQRRAPLLHEADVGALRFEAHN